MESIGSLYGSIFKENVTDSSAEMASTKAKGSMSLASASPSSRGNSKRFEKPMSKTKRSQKCIDKRQMTGSLKRSDKNDSYFSRFSVSKMHGKISSSFQYEKVELVSPQEVVKPRDGIRGTNVKRVADPGNDSSDKKRCDARHAHSYRKWLGTGATKDKVSGSYARGSVTTAESCEKVNEEVVESHPSHSKRRRLGYDSTQQSYSCDAEPGSILHVQDGKEIISELNTDQIEECSNDVLEKDSQLEIKTGCGRNACTICMLGGKLLSCVGKGCKRKFHLSCLIPASRNDPPGVWHCVWCVKKKKELGVHSVSEVESIWDAREVVSDIKVQSEKQYLVKYRGLAHVHNRWIPEKKLLFEAPTLVTKYNSKNQFFQELRWKSEWTVPHRLLQKRKLSFPTNSDDSNLDCPYEWLVKWTGLGYEQATWELENSSFLTSHEAMKLIRDFEIRHQKSERLSSHSEEEKEKCSISELSKLSFGGSPGEYDHYISYVNKLLAHWHKNQNAVVYDDQVDQERVIKVILFVLSLQFTAWRPFLIISKSTALSVWESEFLRVASSASIIVYKGGKDVRSSIRSLEFYNESGSIMFEILLASSDVVSEDLDVLKCIEWGTIVIDECQRPGMSKYFEQFKWLRADMKLLLVSGQIKDCCTDYQTMLSLLDSGYGLSSDDLKIESNTDVCKLKERFARYFAFECKSGPLRFVEYWVPVKLSYLQLEQYCATLLSSSLKSDPADALRELIISIRKCCDHPYLLDQSLQGLVTKGLSMEENLNFGVKVSGKLQILDKILLETKVRGLRVLILFQSIGGSGCDSVGNILDDFLCQRFGKDSYVRIDGGVYARSKKKTVVNIFNNKESGRHFLLLEDRACLPSIKLSAVDVVILFGSDWEPQNDIKALHKISISSQFDQLKVFRLYSSFTVEEKILILAKKGTSVDSNIRTLGRNSCIGLLTWGASHLFKKLDDFHGCCKSVSVSNVSCEESFLNAVFLELLTQLPCSGEINHSAKCSFITEIPQNVVYDENISLFGEEELGSMSNEPSIFSCLKLLEGRHPQWKFLRESSPRNRKKFKCLDDPRKSEIEYGGVIKKRRIAVKNTDHPITPKWKVKGKRKVIVANKRRKLAVASKNTSEKIFPCSTDGKKDVNQNNQLLLKLGISKLCEVLLLPENLRNTAVAFLEYIMQEYDVSWESISSSQAYQISLCWAAADLLKYKINQNESLALAKLRLNLDCSDEEVKYIYSEVQCAAKEFAQCSKKIKGYKKSNCSKRVHIHPQYTAHKSLPSTPSCSQGGTVQSASSNGLDELLTEKTVASLPMETVAGQFSSDSELSCPCDQAKDPALVLDPRQHQSPTRLPATESVEELSEIPQAQCDAVVAGTDLMKTINAATDSNEESVKTDAVTSERATLSKNCEHDGAVNLPGNLNALEFTRTGQSLMEADVNSVESDSLMCQETAVTSSECNMSTIPASMIQHHLSSNHHTFCQEPVVPRHPSLEAPLDESSDAPIMHSVTLLSQQPCASTPELDGETCIENQRSTNTLISPNELPCHVNSVRTVTPQPSCLNPLQTELEKMRKLKEQTLKLHEDMILQLKSKRDKEIEEICKKYDMLFQDVDRAFKQKKQDIDCYCHKVHLNNLLAETLTFNQNEAAAGSPVIDSFVNQLIQQPTLILDPRIEPSLIGLDAAPPVQMSNHLPSGGIARHSIPANCVAQSNRVGIVRAPAPHLRALNPSSISTSRVPALHERMPNQPLASNPQTVSATLPHEAPRPPSESCGIHPPIAADLPVSNRYISAHEVPVDIGGTQD